MIDKGAKRLSAVVLTGATGTPSEDQGPESARTRVIEHLAWTLAQFPFQRFALVGAEANGNSRFEVLRGHQNGHGAGAGIAAALRHLRGGILVAAGNMPSISTQMIEWMLKHDDPNADAVIPRHAGGVEPLFAIYNPSVLAKLDDALQRPGDALRAALQSPSILYVEAPAYFDAAGGFRRVHTAEEYALALHMIRAKSPADRLD